MQTIPLGPRTDLCKPNKGTANLEGINVWLTWENTTTKKESWFSLHIGKEEKLVGYIQREETVYLCILSNIFKHSKETLQQSTFDDATMCHIYKFKWAKHFGYSGLILLFGRKMIMIR
jgi:hypothetical protein